MGKLISNLRRPVAVTGPDGRYAGTGSEFIDVLQNVTVQPWVMTDREGEIRQQGGITAHLRLAYYLQSVEVEPGFSRFIIGFEDMAQQVEDLTPGTVIAYAEGKYVRSKGYFRVSRLVTDEEAERLAARKKAPANGGGRQAASVSRFPSVPEMTAEDELAAAPGRF